MSRPISSTARRSIWPYRSPCRPRRCRPRPGPRPGCPVGTAARRTGPRQSPASRRRSRLAALGEIGAPRGDEGPRRPFLVLGLDLRQMLQQGVDEPPTGVAAILAQCQRPQRRLLRRLRIAVAAQAESRDGASVGRGRSGGAGVIAHAGSFGHSISARSRSAFGAARSARSPVGAPMAVRSLGLGEMAVEALVTRSYQHALLALPSRPASRRHRAGPSPASWRHRAAGDIPPCSA